MTAVEGATISPGEYVATTQTTDPQGELSTEAPVAQVAVTSGIDPAIIETKSGVLARGSATPNAGERLVDAIVNIVVALVDLITLVITRAPSRRDPAPSKPSVPSPGNGVPTKPGASAPAAPLAPVGKRLEAIQDDKGAVTVRTQDGYTVKAEGREAAWTITGPDGKSTRIFGDPHVRESDGDRWDFKQRSTFRFGSNKVTVETVPLKNGNTISSRITVYSGSERVTIGGIDKNRPTIVALASDGRQHDDGLSDGTAFSRGSTKNGETWFVVQNGKKRVMGAK